MVSDTVRKHLMAARVELVRMRADIDSDISQIDAMLNGVPEQRAGTPSPTLLDQADANVSTPSRPDETAWPPRANTQDLMDSMPKLIGDGKNIEDAIISVLEMVSPNAFRTEDIVALLTVTTDWSENGIRSQVAKTAKAGKIHKLKRGLYTLVDPSASVATEAEGLSPIASLWEGGESSDDNPYTHLERRRD